MSKDVERMQGLPKPVWAAGGQWWVLEAPGEQSFGPARILRGPDREGGLAFDDAGRRGAYQADLLNDPRWIYLGDGERPGCPADDQKKPSPSQKDPSPPAALDPERRGRMRDAAEAAALEAPGVWHTGDEGPEGSYQGFYLVIAGRGRCDETQPWRVLLTPNPNFPVEPISRHVVETQPSAVLALLDALEEAERERDALRERLAAAERRNAAWNAHLEALRSDRENEDG